MLESIIDIIAKTGLIALPLFLTGLIGWLYVLEVLRFSLNEKKKHLKPAEYDAILKKFIQHRELPELPPLSLSHRIVGSMLSCHKHSKKYLTTRCREEIGASLMSHFSKLGTIKILAAAAPLMGLLGTVNGMISTFEIISLFGNSNPILMADGISEALLTTQAGLTVAFPLLFMQVLLRNRLNTIRNRLDKYHHRFVSLNYQEDKQAQNSKK